MGPGHWWTEVAEVGARPRLESSTRADVVIVGAGFTGLWTAWYLTEHDRDLDVVVLDQRGVGYGASGRNGGWLVNSMTAGRSAYVHTHGRAETQRFQAALDATVDEVVAVAEHERIEADVLRGGELEVARNPAQLGRLRSSFAEASSWPGHGVEWLEADALAERLRIAGALAATWNPHAARIQPAKLVAGLAAAVERRGVRIFEGSRVDAISARRVQVGEAAVTASRAVIRATEGFTARLAGERRTWLPMNSSLIVTEPLSQAVWDEIGWTGAEVLGDAAHAYMYAQRTADGRIAIGGRGKPYRYASRTDHDGATAPGTVAELTQILHSFFPATADARIDDAWSGVLGVPRDWRATVGFDRDSGVGWAGGYVGTGVAATNLAGRTLADLVLGRSSDLVTLPWVDHRVRRWEPEPLRWLGVQSLYVAYRAADRTEARGKHSRLASLADLVAGRGH